MMSSSLIYQIFFFKQTNVLLKFKLLVKQAIGTWYMNFETNSIVSHRTMAAYIQHSYRIVFLTYHSLLILTSFNDVKC